MIPDYDEQGRRLKPLMTGEENRWAKWQHRLTHAIRTNNRMGEKAARDVLEQIGRGHEMKDYSRYRWVVGTSGAPYVEYREHNGRWTRTVAPVGFPRPEHINDAIRAEYVLQPARYIGGPNHVHYAIDKPVSLKVASLLSGMPEHVFTGDNAATHTVIQFGEDSKMNVNAHTKPEDLEAAAAHAMAEAAAIRAYDALEPQGDEPTISWTWRNEAADKTYSYVAFKANGDGGTDRWYVTGARSCRDGYSWRELGAEHFAKALREGTFLIATEWTAVGNE